MRGSEARAARVMESEKPEPALNLKPESQVPIPAWFAVANAGHLHRAGATSSVTLHFSAQAMWR